MKAPARVPRRHLSAWGRTRSPHRTAGHVVGQDTPAALHAKHYVVGQMKGMECLPLTRQRLAVPSKPFLGGGNMPDMRAVILPNGADPVGTAQNDLVPL